MEYALRMADQLTSSSSSASSSSSSFSFSLGPCIHWGTGSRACQTANSKDCISSGLIVLLAMLPVESRPASAAAGK